MVTSGMGLIYLARCIPICGFRDFKFFQEFFLASEVVIMLGLGDGVDGSCGVLSSVFLGKLRSGDSIA